MDKIPTAVVVKPVTAKLYRALLRHQAELTMDSGGHKVTQAAAALDALTVGLKVLGLLK